MVELNPAELSSLATETGWTSAQTRAQFGAIAWLRWRMMVNAFRRKGGAGEMVARVVVYPVLAVLALVPTLGVGAGAFYLVEGGRTGRVSLLLWVTFGLCQLLNIQLGQPGSVFDPTQLIRFPLRVAGYTCVRLFFGLLSAANVIGTMMALAIAVGVSLAAPALWPYALVAMAVFAAANVLFSRMIFAWVDRWLSTRRAREVFTGLIFCVSLGFQWANLHYNPAYNSGGVPRVRISAAAGIYDRVQPVLQWLPPGMAARSLVAAEQGKPAVFAGWTLGCAAFGAAFLTVFAVRMRTEFRGENLSDAANAVGKVAVRRRPTSRTVRAEAPRSQGRDVGHPQGAQVGRGRWRIPPVLAGMLGKELLMMRRNMGLFYSVVAPLVFVMLFAGKLATRGSAMWVFPAAVAYTLLGVSPLSYNSFGLEGAGAQFYFLAPVRMRDVLLAKNLMNFAVALIEMVAVYIIVSYTAAPPPLGSAAVAVLWAGGTLLVTSMVGNRRSLGAPQQINTARGAGKQASPLSAFLAMGVLLLSGGVAAAIFGAAFWFHGMWVLVPVFAAFFGGALWVYVKSLGTMDRYAMDHREELFAELTKKL